MNYLLKNKFLLLGALFAIFATASLPDVLAMKRKHTDDDDYLPTKKAKFDDGKQEESDDMNIDDSSTSTTLLNLPFDTLNIITEYVINDQENPATRYKLSETCKVFHGISHDISFKKRIKDRIKEAYSPINQTRINALKKLFNLVIISPQFATFNDRFGEDIIEQIIKTALDNCSHQGWLIRAAPGRFTIAIPHNSSRKDFSVRKSALELFSALVNKDQGFDAAIEAATQNSSHQECNVKYPALQLFTALVNKNYQPAYEIAKEIVTPNKNRFGYGILQDAIQAYEARNIS